MEDSEKSYTEMLKDLQQQIMLYKKTTSRKLQKIEEWIEVAMDKMNLRQMQAEKPGFIPDSLHHLELRLPKFEGAEVIKCSPDSEHQEFIRKPIYDEEPGKGQECWPEKEFILEALSGRNPNSSSPLPSEVCTSERSEDGDEPLHTQVIQDSKIHSPLQKMATTKFGDGIDTGFCLDCTALNGPQHLCKQVCLSIMSKEDPIKCLNHNQGKDVPANYSGMETKSSHLDKKIMISFDPGGSMQNSWSKSVMNLRVNLQHDSQQDCLPRSCSTILANRRELLENVPCGDSPIAPNSCGLEKKFTPLDKHTMIIFDPGGLVQRDHLKSVEVIFQDMIIMKERRLEELAYTSEKLVNLDTLMMDVWAWENEFEALASDDITVDCIEKALAFDFLSSVLDSEIRALEDFMNTLQSQMVDARLRISSCGHLRELFTAVEVKLYDSEESLKQSQEHAFEMKMQLTKLQVTSLAINPNDWKDNSNTGLLDDSHGSVAKPQMQTDEQRPVLIMLEKSLARGLDYEKKLTELKQNEEDLKLKLLLTEQVTFFMEEAAEVVWGRCVEAENTAEVLMEISKEMVGRLQVVQFNRNGSIQREGGMKSKLEDCIERLRVKEALEWLDDNQSAEKEDYDEKLEEVEAVCNPIITAVYQRSCSAPGAGTTDNDDNSASSIVMIKEMIKTKGKLDEVAVIHSFGEGQIAQVVTDIIDQCIDSMRAGKMARLYKCIVLRQDNLAKVIRFEVKEVRRRRYTVTIFDPGGYLIVFMMSACFFYWNSIFSTTVARCVNQDSMEDLIRPP